MKSYCTRDRACEHCGLKRTKEGHDPCIANLPGVKNACCGHGQGQGYIQFTNGFILRGFFYAEPFEPHNQEKAEERIGQEVAKIENCILRAQRASDEHQAALSRRNVARAPRKQQPHAASAVNCG
jgi:hypothetical protein